MKRIDFAIDDESQGIFISALSTLEQLIEGEDLGDLFAENLSFGQELAEDDRGFNVRVILEDSLKKEEKNWLGHVRSIIKIPCGKLLISREFVPEDALEAI